MKINEILQNVENVDNELNYWFVRTNYGSLFENFIEGKYIGIGWDYLTLNELRSRTEYEIKDKIARIEGVDKDSFGGKVKISAAYNKILTFISLRKNDVVIIPSRNSDTLAFGRIIDEATYEDGNANEFIKRRKVEWYETKSMEDLNPIFYKVKSNQHTISNINKYSSHINRVIGNLFQKGENTHYVLKIEKTEDINFDELNTLMQNIKKLTQNINQNFEFNENTDDFYIKINLQSKGALELIKSGKSLAVLAYLIFLTSCGNLNNEQDDDLKQFIIDNRAVLEQTSIVLDSLKMNTIELTKPFIADGE